MAEKIDLAGLRFGRLFVVRSMGSGVARSQWLCKCDCGKAKIAATLRLRNGQVRSCGCLRKDTITVPRVDLKGKRFGRLTVLDRGKKTLSGQYFWKCKCDCGALVSKRGNSLQSGNTASCGCLRKEKTAILNKTHGSSHTREYAVWAALKRRCCNPRSKSYSDYGGRGIAVCERWEKSFENFLSDMGNRPSPRHSIERRDNDGDYEPSNCFWATKSQQNKNRRKIAMITKFTDSELMAEVKRRIRDDL